MSRQTVLVVGAEGFIGKHIVTQLAACGYSVYATHYSSLAPPPIPEASWLPCDLTTPEASATWPTQCDSLIYLAQSPNWRAFPDKVINIFKVNVAATLQAAEYARQAGVQRFIFASTGSVYTQMTRPAYEDDPFNLCAPRNFYETTKLAVELMLGCYTALFNVIILRLFVPYGAGQNPSMLIPQLVRRVREGQPISLHGTDGLRINPVTIADVVEAMKRCLALDNSATLNIAGPEVLTLRKIGTCIGLVLGLKPLFETQPDQTPPILVGDTSKLRDTLGWAPEIPFEIGLRNWLVGD